ncbi:hypothetical protein HZB58_03920 [Candidatus Gottesmanbacteria bacterium]|nr:hypothetical protein [Candidatus Gottesmanbacteria bacterium]
MDVITLLGSIGFAFRFGHKAAGLLFLWWRKEYRLDRMRIHLGTKQGESIFFGKTNISLMLLTALWFVPVIRQISYMLLSLALIYLGLLYARSIRRWLLPPISPKVIALLVFFCVFVYGVTKLSSVPLLVAFVIADLLLFPASIVSVSVLTVPTRIYHFVKIRNAVHMLRGHKKMKVMGITGSYGKTSVKEYVSAILSSTYKTLKTDASKNSPIGIAEVIQNKLKKDHEVFVVEMGAYRPGEIAEMTNMVEPEVGILTAINPQHQDLFGSIETTMKAKYELSQGLRGQKILITNLDSEKTRRMAGWSKRDGCDVWGWTVAAKKTAEQQVASHIFRGSDIKVDASGISFDCVYNGQKKRIHAPVLGEHQVGNIMAAVAGAVAMGMSFADAAKAASHIHPAKKVMEIIPGIKGALFIDDTFNNNPDAANAAIRFIGTRPSKKYLVFQPMVELGSYAESSHEDVGVTAAKYCDAILLTNGNFFESFERGVRSISSTVPLLVLPPSEIAMYIRNKVTKDDTVLFKGKDAEHSLHLLV